MLFKELSSVVKNHTKPINIFCEEKRSFWMLNLTEHAVEVTVLIKLIYYIS